MAVVALVSRKDAKKAEAELEAAKTKVAKDKLDLVLAAGHEALGRLKEADQYYRAAVAARPDDPAPLQALAALHLRAGDRAAGETDLRQLLALGDKAPPGTRAWGRRAGGDPGRPGGYGRYREAPSWPRGPRARTRRPRTGSPAPCARPAAGPPGRGHRPVAKARRARRDPGGLPPGVLAQLYERDGRWPQAEAELKALSRAHERNPVYLLAYAGDSSGTPARPRPSPGSRSSGGGRPDVRGRGPQSPHPGRQKAAGRGLEGVLGMPSRRTPTGPRRPGCSMTWA